MKVNIKTIIDKIVSGDWGKEDVDNIITNSYAN